jgi:putative YhbY family RNA-binding protein
MPALELTPAQRREQRGLAHHLDPVVLVGQDGLTPAVLKETEAALKAHGLIKIRVFADDRSARDTMLVELADRLSAAPVQHIGKLLVLWRPLPPKEKTVREDRMAGPRVVKIVKFPKSPTHRPTVTKVRVFGNERVTAGGSIKRAKPKQASPKKKSLG